MTVVEAMKLSNVAILETQAAQPEAEQGEPASDGLACRSH